MKLKELREVSAEAMLMSDMCSSIVRAGNCKTEQDVSNATWAIGQAVLLHDELREHIGALENILKICEAVKQGRYLEDWQRCHWGEYRCEHACTSSDQCDGFTPDPPYTAITYWLSELKPFSEALRGWILYQLQLQRSKRNLLHGPGGLFEGAKLITYTTVEHDDGTTEMMPLSEEDAAKMWSELDAKEDAEHESMGLRVDQYELNLERIRHLCAVKGDLQEIVAIITDGLPPKIVQDISPS
jgi:hypothetical protein